MLTKQTGAQVHRSVLLKAEYFRKALCGGFREAEAQAIELPEEDPAIFHFVVAFLYEDKYVPLLPVADVLGMFVYYRTLRPFLSVPSRNNPTY